MDVYNCGARGSGAAFGRLLAEGCRVDDADGGEWLPPSTAVPSRGQHEAPDVGEHRALSACRAVVCAWGLLRGVAWGWGGGGRVELWAELSRSPCKGRARVHTRVVGIAALVFTKYSIALIVFALNIVSH